MTKGIGESQTAAAAASEIEQVGCDGGLRSGFVDGIQATPDQRNDLEPSDIFKAAPAISPPLRAEPALPDGRAAASAAQSGPERRHPAAELLQRLR